MYKLDTYFQYSLHTISPSVSASVVLPIVLPFLIVLWARLSLENLMSAGLANASMNSQNLDAILFEPCSYYGSASVQNGLKINLRASHLQTFPGVASML